jgi:hypothetical protein
LSINGSENGPVCRAVARFYDLSLRKAWKASGTVSKNYTILLPDVKAPVLDLGWCPGLANDNDIARQTEAA